MKIVRVMAPLRNDHERTRSYIVVQCGIDNNCKLEMQQWFGFRMDGNIKYPFIFDPLDCVFDYGYSSAENVRMPTTFGDELIVPGARFRVTADVRTGSDEKYEYTISFVDVITEQ